MEGALQNRTSVALADYLKYLVARVEMSSLFETDRFYPRSSFFGVCFFYEPLRFLFRRLFLTRFLN